MVKASKLGDNKRFLLHSLILLKSPVCICYSRYRMHHFCHVLSNINCHVYTVNTYTMIVNVGIE